MEFFLSDLRNDTYKIMQFCPHPKILRRFHLIFKALSNFIIYISRINSTVKVQIKVPRVAELPPPLRSFTIKIDSFLCHLLVL